MNLLQKLNERLKSMTKDSKLVKKLASISMAGVMMATLAGCTEPENQDQGNENEQHNEQTIDNEQNKNDEVDYSMYSEILQHTLTNEYFKKANETWGDWGNYEKYSAAIPYGFLENQEYNYDMESIHKHTYDDTKSSLFIMDNKLYIMLSVPIYTDTLDYYHEYLLSYNLTDHELKDLDFLAEKNSIYFGYFIQQLSYEKTAKIENLALISIEARNGCIRGIRNSFLNYDTAHKNYAECTALYLDHSTRTGSKNYKNLKFLVLNNQYKNIDDKYRIQKYTRTMSIGNFKAQIGEGLCPDQTKVFTNIDNMQCLITSCSRHDIVNDQFENSSDEFDANEKTVLVYKNSNYAQVDNYDFSKGYGDYVYNNELAK